MSRYELREDSTLSPGICYLKNFVDMACTILIFLKLLSAIFYQIFIFQPNDSPLNYEQCFLFHLKSSVRSRDIQIFVNFGLNLHTFLIQKDNWKWNNL